VVFVENETRYRECTLLVGALPADFPTLDPVDGPVLVHFHLFSAPPASVELVVGDERRFCTTADISVRR
jgi:hypothetical protein